MYDQQTGADPFAFNPAEGETLIDPWLLGQIRSFLEANPPRTTIQRLTGRSLVPADPQYVLTEESTTSSTFGALATAGPSMTGLPAGKYIFIWGHVGFLSTTGAGIRARMGISINGAAVDTNTVTSLGTQNAAMGVMVQLVTLTGDNNSVVTQYQSLDNAATASFGRRFLACIRYSD